MGHGTELTIDELAHESGVSSRNIRYYQTRGLLPPPKVRGRSGVYGDEHLERLSLIDELKAEGLNLQAIGFLLGGSGSVDTDEVRGLKRAILDGWTTSQPYTIAIKDLMKGLRVHREDAPELIDRAVELELFELTDVEGEIRVLLPEILTAGRALMAMGIGFERSLDVLERLREQTMQVAAVYVELFDQEILAPWDARGRPTDEWRRIRESVEELRPIAGEALLAVFNQLIGKAIGYAIQQSSPTE